VTNPFKKIDQRLERLDRRQQSVENCLMDESKRIAHLEKTSASAETVRWCVNELTKAQQRLDGLETRTTAPLGMDGLTRTERTIREALLTHRAPMTGPEVAEATGLHWKSVSAHLSRLARAGVVDRPKRGVYALPPAYGDHPSRILGCG
jgi:DNA-binding transcriptional ArsR family regulator